MNMPSDIERQSTVHGVTKESNMTYLHICITKQQLWGSFMIHFAYASLLINPLQPTEYSK